VDGCPDDGACHHGLGFAESKICECTTILIVKLREKGGREEGGGREREGERRESHNCSTLISEHNASTFLKNLVHSKYNSRHG
jgi:hypothetical protein